MRVQVKVSKPSRWASKSFAGLSCRASWLVSAVATMSLLILPSFANAISSKDIEDILNQHTFYSPDEILCEVLGKPTDTNPYHVLTYPTIDEAAAIAAIDSYIADGWEDTPFVGLGKSFIAGAKRSNVNPFLAVAHLQVESHFGSSQGGWSHNVYTTAAGALAQNPAEKTDSFNGFGASGHESGPHVYYKSKKLVNGVWEKKRIDGELQGTYYARLVYKWPSWEASLDSKFGAEDWFSKIRRLYLNPGSTYESHDFVTYMSHYAPNSDGNSESGYLATMFRIIDKVTQRLSTTPDGTTTADGAITPDITTADASEATCGKEFGNVSVDGYAFPLEPQSRKIGGIIVGQTRTKHHDGTDAFDLFTPIDSANVYAIYGGTPTRINLDFHGIVGCSTIQFLADDGLYYWYGHLKDVIVQENVHIPGGTPMAKIADRVKFTRDCWGGGPHLHIDRGCIIDGIPQTGGRDECRDPNFIPFLSKLYGTLQ